MDSPPQGRIRVAWICHFSNPLVRGRLPLSRRGRRLGDFAPWITHTIDILKDDPGIELHVISPHIGLRRLVCSFASEGVRYHFFKADLPVIHRHWPRWFSLERATWFLRNRVVVHRLLRRIRPDIVNLHGAENSYYSSTVLGLRGVPVLISIQGIYSNPKRRTIDAYDWLNARIERRIHGENKYFGISAPFMPELIGRDRPDAVLLWNRYPMIVEAPVLSPGCYAEKEYDFMCFSRLVPVKGPEDLLRAFRLVVDKKPSATLRMMGQVAPEYLGKLSSLVLELGLQENVVLSPGASLHSELLREAARGRIYVLPTKIDTIPGTIVEAINLGLPVISYKTGDIPLLNTGKERALLCDAGDIDSLAANMLALDADPERCSRMSADAREFIRAHLSNGVIAANFIEQYRAVIRNFHEGSPVPQRLLYSNYCKELC